MNVVRKLSDWIYQIEKLIAILLLLMMSISLAAGVVFRYFLNSPLIWSDELAMFTFVWVSFIGGSMALKKQALSSVSVIMDRFKGRIRCILLSFGFGLVSLFCAYFFWISIPWIMDPNISVQKSTAMGLSMLFPYLSVPISLGFMTIHSLEHFLHSLRSIKTLEEVVTGHGHEGGMV